MQSEPCQSCGVDGSCGCKPQAAQKINWQALRGGFWVGLACLTSPCCSVLYVPLLLALLAGTPAAAWMTYHQGWVYGGLTLISVLSLARWLWRPSPRKARPSQPVLLIQSSETLTKEVS